MDYSGSITNSRPASASDPISRTTEVPPSSTEDVPATSTTVMLLYI